MVDMSQVALARQRLQLGQFQAALELSRAVLEKRPTAARPKAIAFVAAIALGIENPLSSSKDEAELDSLILAAYRGAIRRKDADAAARLNTWASDAINRLTPDQRTRGSIHSLSKERERLLLCSEPTDKCSEVSVDTTDGKRLHQLAREATRQHRWLLAMHLASSAAEAGTVDAALSKRLHTALMRDGYLDEARIFSKAAPARGQEKQLLQVKQLVEEGEYEHACSRARALLDVASDKLAVARAVFHALRAQRQHATALPFGLMCLQLESKPSSTFGYSVARTANLCESDIANIALGLRSAFNYADAAVGTDEEQRNWSQLFTFRLLSFDVSAASQLLQRLPHHMALEDEEVCIARRHLRGLKEELSDFLGLLAEAGRRLRDFAEGKLPQLDSPLPGRQVVIHVPGGWLTDKPKQNRLRQDVRPAFFELMRILMQQRVPFQIIPQLGANEFVIHPSDRHLTIAYHTICSHPNVVNIKGSDLPHYLYFDRAGYAGWSELAQRSQVELEEELRTYNFEDIETFFQAEKKRVMDGNVSKYPQPDKDTSLQLPEHYVFVALQTRTDKVQELAYVPMLTMLQWIVERFRRTRVKVVVKRHPDCHDPLTAQALRRHSSQNDILVTTASIHQVIERCLAVFTVNSGVGCEALIHLKPVYLFGKADYHHVCHTVRSSDELKELTSPVRHAASPTQIKTFLYWYRRTYLIDTSVKARLRDALLKAIADFNRKLGSTSQAGL